MSIARESGTAPEDDRQAASESADGPESSTLHEAVVGDQALDPPVLDQVLDQSPAPHEPALDGRFVPAQFLHLLQRSSLADVQLGDCTEKTIAVMFADIRGFTTLSESMSPQQNLKFLNAYLGRMERVIAQNNGFIDKYIGDAIMALFEGDPDQAVEAAVEMLHALSDYNQERVRAGRSAIRIGIGLDVGPLILGTIGGIHRMETTAIGDAVNLAARLEELTKQYSVSVLVSHRMLAAMNNPSKYSIRFIDRLYVRGRTQPVAVYEVLNADPIESQTLKRAATSLFEEGVLRFHRRQYREAAALFEECLNMNPTDRATHIYLQRSVLAGFPPSEHTWQLVKGKVIHKRKRYRGRYRARSR
ncbi:MAG TPA: adenylate/guanylate cyclase domain-containing protein [Coleofasciculaceae cyanobacterium]